jgi:hypothetical protein
MIVDRMPDGSVVVSSIIDGHLKSERYYLPNNLTTKQVVREAYKQFKEKYE